MSQADNEGIGSALRSVAVAVTILFVLLIVLSTLVGSLSASADDLRVDASGSTIDVDGQAQSISMVDSTGQALYYGQNSGHVELATDGGVGDGNTTVSVWAALDEQANTNDDFHVVNLGNGSVSVQYRGGDWYGYYDKTGGGVAEVSANATAPHGLDQVGLVANGTHLQLVADGSTVDTTAFDPNATTSVPSARTWWGTQDELRVWDAPLNDSQLASHVDDPILPVARDDATLRMMLDEGSGSSTHVLIHGSTASLVGDVGWTEGLPGQELLEGEDWTFDGEGTITIADGSRLDTLNVAYLSYGDWMQEVADTAGPALILAGAVPIVLIAVMILREIRGVSNNGGRI